MSTITVTNIKATGETASRSATGVAAMYVSVDQTTVSDSILQSFNATSVTDNGQGSTTINYTNSFTDTTYATTYGIRDGGGENDSRLVNGSGDSGYLTSSSQRVYCAKPFDNGGIYALDDLAKLMVVNFGDLA